MITKRWFFLILLALAGCNLTSDDDSTYATQAQLQKLSAQVTALSNQVATLQGATAGNVVLFTPPSASSRTNAILLPGEVPAATTATVAAGTFLGPFNGNVVGMTTMVNKSSTGYLYCTPGGPGNHSACLMATVLFEQANCQGTAAFIVPNQPLSALNVANGVVIGIGADGDTTSTDYYMVPPSPASQADFANSEISTSGTCTNITPGPNNFSAVWEAQPNNQTVTGVPSGVIGSNPTIN